MKREEFYQCVYETVARIPRGKVMTYGQIAGLLGFPHGARRVGQAMVHAPESLNLPCHRVVNSKGELAPVHVFGGKVEQMRALQQEGVAFRENGNIDLAKSKW